MPPPPRLKRWTKQEYCDLYERGAFRGMRLHLFRGEVYEIPPQHHPHGFAVMKLHTALGKAFGLDTGFEFRIQLPFDVPGESMPEPDALVCTTAQGERRPHPSAAVLVIEVADSSLAYDREKALEYAAAQVPEYWIIDVNRRRIEVYRNPVVDATTELGFRYPPPTFIETSGSVAPRSGLGSAILVAQFFHD